MTVLLALISVTIAVLLSPSVRLVLLLPFMTLFKYTMLVVSSDIGLVLIAIVTRLLW